MQRFMWNYFIQARKLSYRASKLSVVLKNRYIRKTEKKNVVLIGVLDKKTF